jgi:hypothetical protein
MPIVALAAAGAGLASALLHGALLTGSFGAIILAYLAQLPLFVIGLWMGYTSVAIAAVTAVIVLAAAGGFLFALAYLLVNAAPALLMTYLAQHSRTDAEGTTEWYPPGLLITWLVCLAAAAFLGLAIAYADAPGGAEGLLRRGLESAFRQLGAPGSSTDNPAIGDAAAAIARFMPGIVAGSWMAMVVVNGVLAQGLLVRFKRHLRPSPQMADIDLPTWLLGAVAIGLIGAFMPGNAGFLGANLFLIFMPAYVLAGLGVVHALSARLTSRGLLLTATYTLLLLFGWPLIIAALLGLAEPWLNLRRRFGGGAGT